MNRVIDRIKKRFFFKRATSHIITEEQGSPKDQVINKIHRKWIFKIVYLIDDSYTVKLQNDMLATRVINVNDEEVKDSEGKQELDSIVNDQKDFSIYSDSFTGFVRMKTDIAQRSDEIGGFSGNSIKKPNKLKMSLDTSDNLGRISNEYVNKTLVELTQTNQGQNDEISSLKRDLLELNDLKSLKEELKNAIQVQKDGIKSYHIMKKEVSTIKDYLQMVYGKKCFDRKK